MSAIAVDRSPAERCQPVEGRVTPLERLEALCDPGSLHADALGRRCSARSASGRAPATAWSPAPGASTAGRSSATRRTRRFLGGSLGEAHADSIVRVMRARRPRRRAGRRLRRVRRRPACRRAIAALARLRAHLPRAASRSRGKVPQISVDHAASSAGGGAYSPALTDFVVMTERLARCSSPARGRARGHGRGRSTRRPRRPAACTRKNGVCQFVARTTARPRELARELLAHLPQRARRAPPRSAPAGRPLGTDPRRSCPSRAAHGLRRARRDRAALVDGGAAARGRPRAGRATWSPRFGRIEGRAGRHRSPTSRATSAA